MSGIVLESFISCSQADELLALDEEISDEETSPLILGTVRFVAVVSFRKIRVFPRINDRLIHDIGNFQVFAKRSNPTHASLSSHKY